MATKRLPYQGMARQESKWLKEHNQARKDGKKFIKESTHPNDIEISFLSNCTPYPPKNEKLFNRTANPRMPMGNIITTSALLKELRKPEHKTTCIRWDGMYFKNKPYFGLLKLLPDNFYYYVDKYLFFKAFGDIPARKRLYPNPNKNICIVGLPRGISDGAWCVNPYHKMMTDESTEKPDITRRWTEENYKTFKKWRTHYYKLMNVTGEK